MTVGERIKARRLQLSISAEELAAAIGKTPSTVYRWENGDIRKVDSTILETIADALHTTPGDLLGWEQSETRPLPQNLRPIGDLQRQRVPLIGHVAAGQPIMAEEDLETFVTAPIQCDVALTVEGDSMKLTYLDGDILFIKRRPDVQEGAVAVVLIDDSAALKHVYKRPEGLTLISDNPEYAPMFVDFADHDFIQIYGVPVGYQRIYKPSPRRGIRRGVR